MNSFKSKNFKTVCRLTVLSPVTQPTAFFCCLVVDMKPPALSKVSLFVFVLSGHAQSQTWPLTSAVDTDALCGAEHPLWFLSACSLIMHNAYAAILRPCSTHAQSRRLSFSHSVKKHLTPSSVHSHWPPRMPWHSQRRFHSPVNNPGIDISTD